MGNHQKGMATPQPNIRIIHDERDKFRVAAADALLIRAGVQINDITPGAQNMCGMRLRDFMDSCVRREGIQNSEFMSIDELLRQFSSPSASFPAILDTAVNKSYVSGYQSFPATFDLWTVKGQLSDFKPSKTYSLGNAGEFSLVPEGGELKHDTTHTYQRPERKLQTWGRQFTMTREAIINDDIDLVTTIPSRYGAAAKRTINKQVYTILASNPVIFDGINLFDAAHKNIVTVGSSPDMAAMQNMVRILSTMLDNDGETILAVPRYIIVPIGLGDVVRQIIGSVTITVNVAGVVNSQSNPMYGRGLEVIEDAQLNEFENGEFEWYLAANKISSPTIGVDYLNGNDIPNIRRIERSGQLGYIWDLYLDWCVTVYDYRGIVKNPGKPA
jgi:hypothetical protein